VLRRALDALLAGEDNPEVRRNVGILTTARLFANTCYRFAPPFLATIARGLDVSLDDVGVALAVAELAGLLSPLTARLVDRFSRRTMLACGLAGTALGAALAAGSTGVVMFAVALVVVSQSKVAFDLGLASWVADHVPYERRSRVVGLTETSWALGLLVGVSIAGIVTGLTNWRVGYAVAAGAVALMAVLVARRLPREDVPGSSESLARPGVPPATRSTGDDSIAPRGLGARGRLGARGWWVVLGAFGLMCSSQSLFVTFGSWLEDAFSFRPAAISAVVFGLGLGELLASITAARRTDRWGKLRSTMGGAGLLVPAGIGLAVFHGHLVPGLIALAIGICGFEFAIVSLLAVGSTLVPGSPARGLAIMLTGGTFGRALAAVPATRLFDRHGMAWPALQSAGFAVLTVVALGMAARAGRRSAPTPTV
jgi:DHA1 family inner membrane transport protein